MYRWQDKAIILSKSSLSSGAMLVSALTENNGRHLGVVKLDQKSIKSSSRQIILSNITISNFVTVNWQASNPDNLGKYKLSLEKSFISDFYQEKLYTGLIAYICNLCDVVLPEREKQSKIFHAVLGLLSLISDNNAQNDQSNISIAIYLLYIEYLIIHQSGYGFDILSCALSLEKDIDKLNYISPATGRAVTEQAAKNWRNDWNKHLFHISKLFKSVILIVTNNQSFSVNKYDSYALENYHLCLEIQNALRITEHFINKNFFIQYGNIYRKNFISSLVENYEEAFPKYG